MPLSRTTPWVPWTAFAYIPVPGRQIAERQEVNKKIKITGYRFAVDC